VQLLGLTVLEQLHTLQATKSWVGPGNEARVGVSATVRAYSARAAPHTAGNEKLGGARK